MKRTGFLFLMFAAISAISCLKEETPQAQGQGMYFTFEAAREALSTPDAQQTPAVQQVATKTVLVDNNKVQWVKNDRVGVYNGINENGSETVTAVDNDGETFKAEVAAQKWIKGWEFAAQNDGANSVFKAFKTEFDATGNDYLLIYPRSWNYFCYNHEGTKRIRFWITDRQKPVQGTFDPAAGYAVAKTTSLTSTPENPIVFKNVLSLLKFTIPAELAGQITQIAVWGRNSEYIGGEMICDYSGDEPVVTSFNAVYTDCKADAKGKTAVQLNESNGMAAGYYYMAICPGEFSKGLVVQVTSKSGRIYRREKQVAVTLKGGVIYDMGEIEAETYDVKAKGVSALPYVFSLTNKSTSGNTAKYLTSTPKAVHYSDKKYAEGSLTDGNVGAVMTYRMAARTTADVYTLDSYWNEGRGSYNIPASSLISEDYEAGYGANFKLAVPINMTMPKSFSVTYGMRPYGGAIAMWKLQYSNDDKTWYDGAQITVWGNAYCKYTVNITPEIAISDMLYLKWIPVGTTLVSGGTTPWKAQVRFWGGVVIADLTKQTTPKPAGAIFFEGFDDMIGGVDYLHGGQENGLDKLGLLSDCYGQTIGSGTDPKAPKSSPVTWNNLTCSLVAMRPGYAQIGHPKIHQASDWNEYQNYIGKITTPKLAEGTLSLSFKAMMYRNPLIGLTSSVALDNVTADKIVVNVVGGGTFEDGTTSKTISGVSYSAFNTYSLTVKNATADTQVEFTSPSDVPSTRWFIDDICVMKDGADTDVARTIQVANPDLKIALPKKSASNGKLVIMVPGGGYSGMNLVGDREGDGWASYYNERGIACATLRYTLPAGNCLLPVNDLKNAIKYIREHSAELGVTEIGVHGFSAGGHLASTGATHFTGELRPDFQILFYPVITLRNATHSGSRNQFLGSNPSQYMLDLYSNELQVTKDTPKAFVMYYVPDTVVPQATNGAAYVEALKANNVPVTTLIYDTCYPDSDTQNGHGWWERDTRIDGKHVKEHLSDWLQTL